MDKKADHLHLLKCLENLSQSNNIVAILVVVYNYAFVDNEDRYNNYIVVIIRFTSIY